MRAIPQPRARAARDYEANKYELPGRVTDLVRGFLLNGGANLGPRLHFIYIRPRTCVIRFLINAGERSARGGERGEAKRKVYISKTRFPP